jgi:DNA-binding CsgD family transcriptional regulator
MTAPVLVGPSPSSGGPVPSPDWDEVLADIGDRVRAERKARGWAQDKLAARAGLNRRTVRNIEAGIGTLRTFAQVCWALGVAMDHLLSDRWELPERQPRLSATQVRVLREAASGDSLAQVGARLLMSSRLVAAHLSHVYRLLGVAGLPQGERRAAAARVAMQHGLFDTPPNRTS